MMKQEQQQDHIYRKLCIKLRQILHEEDTKKYPLRNNSKKKGMSGQPLMPHKIGQPLKHAIHSLTKKKSIRYNIGTLLNGELNEVKNLAKKLNLGQITAAQIQNMTEKELKYQQKALRIQLVQKYQKCKDSKDKRRSKRQNQRCRQALDTLFLKYGLEFDPNKKLKMNGKNSVRGSYQDTHATQNTFQTQCLQKIQKANQIQSQKDELSYFNSNSVAQIKNQDNSGFDQASLIYSSFQALIDQKQLDLAFNQKKIWWGFGIYESQEE